MNYVVVAHCPSLVASLCDVCGSRMSGHQFNRQYCRSPTASAHLFALLKEISLKDFPSLWFSFFFFLLPFIIILLSIIIIIYLYLILLTMLKITSTV